MSNARTLITWSILAGILALGACGGEKGPGTDGPSMSREGGVDGGAGPPSFDVSGRIFDARTGLGVADAELRTSDRSLAKSDAKGDFELSSAPELGLLSVLRRGYAPTRKAVPAARGYLEIFLKNIDERVEFRGDQGVTVELVTGERLVIPEDAVLDREGRRVRGVVTLELAAIDGRSRAEASALPGDGVAQPKEGSTGRIGIEAALEIRILDADGRELDVDPKREVLAEVPERRSGLGSKLDLYSYDEQRDRWREEGVASRVEVEGKGYYRADIEHLSWWSFGRFHPRVSCVRACVESTNGKKVGGAQVWVVGASVAGVGSFFTDTKGCGAVDVVAGSEVVLVAQATGLVSAPKAVVAHDKVLSAAEDSKACADAGTLVLGPAFDADCPSGFEKCGAACADLISSAASCGSCDGMCEAPKSCIAAKCSCAEGDAECSAQGDGGVPTDGITVRGKVVDPWDQGVADYSLRVGGQLVTTTADGTFSVPNVVAPYSITYDLGNSQYAYFGVTRPDPKLTVTNVTVDHSATLQGETTGGIGYPMPAGHMTNITVAGNFQGTFDARQLADNPGVWSGPGPMRWRGASAIQGTLFGIQHNMSTFAFTGMGSKSLTLEDGGEYTSPAADLVLAPVTTRTVSGSITVPGGGTASSVVLRIGTFSRALTSPGSSYSIAVPNGIPADVRTALIVSGLVAGRSSERWYDLDPNDTNVDLEVPDATTLVAPPDGATGVADDAEFQCAKPPNMITVLTFTWSAVDSMTQQTVTSVRRIHLTADSISIAKLAAAGIELPRDQLLSWNAQGLGPVADVDALLAPTFSPYRTFSSYSAQRTVTLAP